MLLCDADVEEALWEALLKRREAGRTCHGSGNRHDVLAVLCRLNELLGKSCGPTRLLLALWHAGDWVDGTGGVHLILRLVDGWGKAVALFRYGVDDDWAVVVAGVGKRAHHGVDVVAINGANILNAKLWEHLGRHDGGLHAVLDGMQRIEGALADPAHGLQALFALFHDLVVAMLGTDTAQVLG